MQESYQSLNKMKYKISKPIQLFLLQTLDDTHMLHLQRCICFVYSDILSGRMLLKNLT